MGRRSRGARRRTLSKARKHAADLEDVKELVRHGHELDRATVEEPDADGYVDDLRDTIGDKRPLRTKLADRLNSALPDEDYTTYTVKLPNRFVAWLENYAKQHGTDPSGVFDFAVRQIWRDDANRTMGQEHSMPKVDFDAMNG